jgi:FtsP/CotA-like multicopper oxidase with cupredoxin domain
VPLVIQDRTFDRGQQLVYLAGAMMERMLGFLGNRILVNGWPDYHLHVESRSYRLRLLNGSNSRVYKLAWEDERPLTVIGTDGGLLERPVTRSCVTLGPAERVELWVDFSRWPLGSTLRMVSLPFDPGTIGTLGAGSVAGLSQGAAFPVMTVTVARPADANPRLPGHLTTMHRYVEQDSVNHDQPRIWEVGMKGMTWTINGRSFEMEGVHPDETVRLGTQETWLFDNSVTGQMGMMGGMRMIHPMHIHGLQFQIVERQVEESTTSRWNSLSEGYVDDGWKDSFLLLPNERAKVLLRFDDYAGLYLVHCHNLEHEDLGMMRNYLVVP